MEIKMTIKAPLLEWIHVDPRIQSMPEDMQRRLFMLLFMDSVTQCNAKKRHMHEYESQLSFLLRIDRVELEKTKKYLVMKGCIDDAWNIIDWRSHNG
jgi:hypothetical protein